MATSDFINRLMGHLLRGDVTGALEDVGDVLDDALGPPQKGQVGPPQMGLFSPVQLPQINASPTGGLMPGMNPVGRTSGKHDAAQPACCNRFSLSDGFLVDGVSGRVWQFNTTAGSFDEVPVNNSGAKQKLVDAMLEGKLSAIRDQYEREMLATVPRTKRAAALNQFEKDHLDPLRDAAQGVTY